MNLPKIITLTSLALLTTSYAYSIYNSQYKIAITATGKIYKVTAQGLTLMIKYNIKNPTGITLKMTPPLIVLSVNNKQLATSNMQIIDIPENARDKSGKIVLHATKETGDIEAQILVPWINVAQVIPDLAKRYTTPDPDAKAVKKIEVKITVHSQIYTLGGRIPYEQVSIMKI